MENTIKDKKPKVFPLYNLWINISYFHSFIFHIRNKANPLKNTISKKMISSNKAKTPQKGRLTNNNNNKFTNQKGMVIWWIH